MMTSSVPNCRFVIGSSSICHGSGYQPDKQNSVGPMMTTVIQVTDEHVDLCPRSARRVSVAVVEVACHVECSQSVYTTADHQTHHSSTQKTEVVGPVSASGSAGLNRNSGETILVIDTKWSPHCQLYIKLPIYLLYYIRFWCRINKHLSPFFFFLFGGGERYHSKRRGEYCLGCLRDLVHFSVFYQSCSATARF